MQTLRERTHNGIKVYVRNSEVVAYLLYGIVNERVQCSELIHLRMLLNKHQLNRNGSDRIEWRKKIIDFQTTITNGKCHKHLPSHTSWWTGASARFHCPQSPWSEWKTVDHQLEQWFRLFAMQLHHFPKTVIKIKLLFYWFWNVCFSLCRFCILCHWFV